jgi:hypothetical protein
MSLKNGVFNAGPYTADGLKKRWAYNKKFHPALELQAVILNSII